jgi:outer membrane murein-binding lipoprotein Lpp
MNTNLKLAQRIAAVLFVGVVLAGCASAPNAPSPELLQQIESARTRADYEALATYYDREATAARATAVQHRKMAKSYQGGGRGTASMPAHCNAIASNSESLAAEYEGMAAGYRQMAKQAQP